MSNILNKLRQELQANADEKIQQSSLRFFKEEIKCYGLKNSLGDKIFCSTKR